MAKWVSLGGSGLPVYFNRLVPGNSSAHQNGTFSRLSGYPGSTFLPGADPDDAGTWVFRMGNEKRVPELAGKVIRGYKITFRVKTRAEGAALTSELEQANQPMGIAFSLGGSYLPLFGAPALERIGRLDNVFLTYDADVSPTDPSVRWHPENFADTEKPGGIPVFGTDFTFHGSATRRYSGNVTVISGGFQQSQRWYMPERHFQASAEAMETPGLPLGYFPSGMLDIANAQAPWAGFALQVGHALVGSSQGQYAVRTPVRPELPVFDVLVSNAPMWKCTAPNRVGVGLVSNVLLEGRAWYPDSPDEPLANLTVVVSCNANYLSVSPDGEVFSHHQVVKTDAAGKFKLHVRGEKAGTVDLRVECGNDAIRNVFQPGPFSGIAAVTVYDGSGDGDDVTDPGDEPPIDGEPGETPPIEDVVTECITYPETPGTPGVPARYDTVKTMAWDAGANSVSSRDGDLRLTFTHGKVVGVVLGLVGERGDVTDRRRIPYAFYLSQTQGGRPQFDVMELGEKVASGGAYVPDVDEFEIRRAGSTVTYWHAGELIHTSRTPSSGLLLASCAVFASSDTVPGAP